MASVTSALSLVAPPAPSTRAAVTTSGPSHIPRPALSFPSSRNFLLRAASVQAKPSVAPGSALRRRALTPRAGKEQFVEDDESPEDSARRTAESLRQKTQGAAEDVRGGAQEAGEDLRSRAEGAGEYLGARADEAGKGLRNRAGAAGEYLGERADDAREAAAGAVGGAGQRVQEAGKEVAQTTQSGLDQWASQARAAVQNLAGSLFGRAEEAGQEAKGSARAAQQQGQGAWDSTKGVAGELSDKVQSGAQEVWEGAKATAQDARPPRVPIEAVGGSTEEASPAGNTTAGSGEQSGKTGAGGIHLNLQQQRETEPEQLRTGVSGDVKGWTGSGDFSAEDAEKRGMSEGEYLAARLVDRAKKENP